MSITDTVSVTRAADSFRMRVTCQCGHRAIVNITRYGAMPLAVVASRLTCSRCWTVGAAELRPAEPIKIED